MDLTPRVTSARGPGLPGRPDRHLSHGFGGYARGTPGVRGRVRGSRTITWLPGCRVSVRKVCRAVVVMGKLGWSVQEPITFAVVVMNCAVPALVATGSGTGPVGVGCVAGTV